MAGDEHARLAVEKPYERVDEIERIVKKERSSATFRGLTAF